MSHVTHINESSESKSRVECSGKREQESERAREQESKRARERESKKARKQESERARQQESKRASGVMSGVMSVAICNSKSRGWWHDAREYESCHTYG